MGEPHELDVVALLEAFATGALTPSEALESCLAQIDALDEEVGAVLTLTADTARQRAQEASRRWRDGTARPLEGVPFGVKDVVATAGVRTTGGARLFGDHVPQRSAVVVERLEAAGAVLVGKLQTFTLALGGVRNGFGTTRNPWDPARTTGGTSSGSAAAVAARMLPLAIGTDTGGSLRLPAAYCHVSALKPTYGRVPRTGVMPLSWTLDHVGPMARSVADLAVALAVIEGADADDPTSLAVPAGAVGTAVVPEQPLEDLRGLRVGVPDGWFAAPCQAGIAEAASEMVDTLAELGAQIRAVSLPHAEISEAVYWPIVLSEGASLHESHLDLLRRDDPDLAVRLGHGTEVRAVEYLRALRLRRVLQADCERAFDEVDVMVVPTSRVVAPRLDDLTCEIEGRHHPWIDVVSHLTCPFNVTGLPSLSIPAGFSCAGLPVGVQVVAPPFADARCLRVGAAWQAVTEHHRARPPLLG